MKIFVRAFGGTGWGLWWVSFIDRWIDTFQLHCQTASIWTVKVNLTSFSPAHFRWNRGSCTQFDSITTSSLYSVECYVIKQSIRMTQTPQIHRLSRSLCFFGFCGRIDSLNPLKRYNQSEKLIDAAEEHILKYPLHIRWGFSIEAPLTSGRYFQTCQYFRGAYTFYIYFHLSARAGIFWMHA